MLTPLNQSKTHENYSVKNSEKTNIPVPNLMKQKDVKKENVELQE